MLLKNMFVLLKYQKLLTFLVKNHVLSCFSGCFYMESPKYDRPILELPMPCPSKMRDNEFCDVTLASVNWSKVKNPQSYTFSIKYLLPETITELLKSSSINVHVTLIYTKHKLKETRWSPQ